MKWSKSEYNKFWISDLVLGIRQWFKILKHSRSLDILRNITLFCSHLEKLILLTLTGLGVLGALNVILSEMSSRPPALLFLEKPLLLRSNPLFSLLIKAAFLDMWTSSGKKNTFGQFWVVLQLIERLTQADINCTTTACLLFFHCLHIELIY